MLVKLPVTLLDAVPTAIPVILEELGADQEYVVPAGTIFPDPFVGATVKVPPEQIAVV